MRVAAACGLAAMVALAACASGSDEPPAESTLPASIGTLEVESARDMVLGWLNGDEISEADYGQLFDAGFRSQVAYGDVVSVLADVAPQGPWSQADVVREGPTETVFRVVSDGGGALLVSLALDTDSGQFTGLLLQPDAEFEPPASVDAALDRLRAVGTVRLLVADVTDGSCVPLVDAGSTDVVPIGSVFKLYVLGAVVEAIAEGTISWDTPVLIDDALDSLPSGDTQDVEPGTALTVRELADMMVSVSDNTATDHLIDLVGRDAVEAVLEPMGNDALARNLPLLTTRELFILKWGPVGLADRYLAADEAGRRALLDGEVAAADLPPAEAVDPLVPVRVDELEWFASPQALCRAMLFLSADETATEILAANPGIADADGRWSDILFKGGGEPGLVAVAWLTVGDDGAVRTTTGAVVNTSAPIDDLQAVQLFGWLRDSAD